MKKLNLAILGSTRGTDLLALITAEKNQTLQATIALVVSNKLNAGILEKADQNKIQNIFLDPKSVTKDLYDETLSALLLENKIDLIVLIGYMRILSASFVNAWRNKIINVHPSLLPAYAGAMDVNVHEEVLKNKEKQTGCTVHYVTEEVDAGPILLQKQCDVLPNDNAETLKARVQQLEGEALIEVINQLGAK